MGEMPVGTLTLPDSQHVVPEYWSAHGAAWQLQGCYDWTQQRVWDRHSSVLCSAAGSRVISQALTPVCHFFRSSLLTSAGLESQGRTPSPSPPYSSSPSPSR